MDSARNTRNNKYDRVMPRVHNQSSTSLKSSSFVTRHDIPSSVRVGAKSVTSNVSSSGVFNELPTFLNDYVAEPIREKVVRTHVVKPRRTIKSLEVAASPPRTTRPRELIKKPSNIRAQESAPSVLINNGEKWSATHLRECMSSRSHSRLKDLKDEIKAYKEADKLMRLRSSLFKKCGVVLDDVGNVTQDKAVQAKLTEEEADDTGQKINR
ncbi:hypothetical protein PYW08_012033 [Mythimna loreyi]|uniref:Uncharacterized protein n=1 Tax=Mythimna loreyi TaxID=667449 RepID=A0ACC2QM39_9NEOP|nr:hypothetical protein PYW08_012033 [Mythimna loreyi]